jgi:diguanylate cyclase (GGDEF)-like protein/PAS domain S-box-containing protein
MSDEYHILIVDDDKVTIRAIYNKLEKSTCNFVLHEKHDGKSAIDYLKKNKMDCIILDYLLPGISGLDLIHKFKEENIITPVVMLTGEGDEKVAVEALKAGAHDYINKSYLGTKEFTDILSLSITSAISHQQKEVEKAIARLALEMSEERYRGLIEKSPMLIFRVFPDDNTFSFVNDGFCKYFQTNRFDMIGESIFSIVPEDQRAIALEKIHAITYDEQISNFETENIINNKKKWQTWTVQGVFDDSGEIIELQCMGKDITDIKKVEQQLINQKLFLQTILDFQENMVIVANPDDIIEANQSFLDFVGYESLKKESRIYESLVNSVVEIKDYMKKPQEEEGLEVLFKNALNQKLIALRSKKYEKVQIFSLSLSKLPIGVDTYIIEFSNVTEFEEKSQKLESQAGHDTLTNIFNRRKFDQSLKQFLSISKRYHNQLAVIYFDIDYFKKINDTYGHQAGDTVLVELSKIVNNNVRTSDIFARWGGEEFVILSPEINFDEAVIFAEKLRKMIRLYSFEKVGNVTCSFGVTNYVSSGETKEAFLKRADKALYTAKANGRNKVVGIRKK